MDDEAIVGKAFLVLSLLAVIGFYYWRLWLLDPQLALAGIAMACLTLITKAVT